MSTFTLERWNQQKRWGTHIAMLIKTVQLTDKPVLELGSGPYSTPILHWLCRGKGLKLYTYEDTPIFYEFARDFISKLHQVTFINNWDEIPMTRQYGVVFIDHHPTERRGVDVLKFKDNADFIVIHDSNKEKVYGYDKCWAHFKYRYDWKEANPTTTVLSNFVDVTKFGE